MLALNDDVPSQGYPQENELHPAEKAESHEEYDRGSPGTHEPVNYLDWASNLLEQSNDFMEAFDFSEGLRKGLRKPLNMEHSDLHASGAGVSQDPGQNVGSALAQTSNESQDQSQNENESLNRNGGTHPNPNIRLNHAILSQNIPNHAILSQNIPNHAILGQNNLNHNIPSQNIPSQNIPNQNISSQNFPSHNILNQSLHPILHHNVHNQGINGLHDLQPLLQGVPPHLRSNLQSVLSTAPLPKDMASLTPEGQNTPPDKNYALPPHLQSQARSQLPWGMPERQPSGIRSKRPCDHCRRRKTKCVVVPGAKNCVQCETKSLICTYLPPKQEEESAAKRARAQGNSPLMDSVYRQPNMEIVPPNVSIRDVAPVQDYSLISKSLLRKTLSLQFPRSSYYIGPTSYLYDTNIMDVIINGQNKAGASPHVPNGPPSNKIEQVNLSDSISLRKVGAKTQFVLKDDQSKQSYLDMSNDVDTIEKFVAPHGQILIDLYFRIIHPSYPILHKKVFLEKYSRTHREFSAPVLAAVYVLAIQWWDYDPQLNRFPKPNVRLILKIALNNYTLEILKRPKLSAVQGGLLLLQCKHILREFAASDSLLSWTFSDCGYNDWVLCSQIIALSEELGLGLDCDHWKLPKWERGLRKRLSWAVFMEHQWLALKNARPTHIDANNWEVLQLVEEDFPEKHGDGDLKEGSADINNGKKNFTNLIRLSQILADIVNSLFSMRAMREVTEIEDVLRIAKPIQLKLRTWYHSLPVELQMNSVQPRKLCPNGYLQLAYFATELTLHRKIITVLHQLEVNGKPVPNEIRDVCRTAAKTRLIASVEFVRDLKPEHIHSFWHSSSSENFALIGTFAALLFASSLSKQEADYYKDQIFNYRWILKISSKGFVQVGDALRKLDVVLTHIPGLLNENSDQPMVVPNVPTIDYSKIYQHQQMLQSLPLSQALADSVHLSQATTAQQYSNHQGYSPSNSQFSALSSAKPNSINSINNKPRNNIINNGIDPSSNGDDVSGMNKMPSMTGPTSALQYRNLGVANSPYASPQASNSAAFSAYSGSAPRGNQGGPNLSPKEIIRQQKPLHGTEPLGDPIGRRGSSASHNSEAMSNKDNQSSRSGSPLMMRSPLSLQQQPHSASNNHSDS